ncbi:hypothetical protein Cme02nite_01960 [Catellatospora methionotrophica]|uniref:Uncharacterized protein n=1 Tax=Catellatospora methionotrophica TaxID=121620 RepID=A0A8J3L5G2_9ACTN|nr:hypothetical protein [Catellatospora methionotrophica]GIG11864.1 hypothetical protein Cme02nite_01960 [Catellatospora methionotrophica]
MGSGAVDDADRIAGSLQAWLATVAFVDLDVDQVTEALTETVLAWGRVQGWRVYRRARSVVKLPAPYEDRHSWVDVGVARAGGESPIVIEIDRSERRRTLEKLTAEAAEGRVAVWLRWGTGPFTVPDGSVRLVTCEVSARKDASGHRVFSAPVAARPAPAHSGVDLAAADQGDLFATGGPNPA